jgi:hypothetical protein
VRSFHDNTLTALGELVEAAGLAHPSELRPAHILRRLSVSDVRSFTELYPRLAPGELLKGTDNLRYAEQWALADPSSFSPRVPVRIAA